MQASDFSNVGEWPTLIGGVSGSGKATVNETKRSSAKKHPVSKAAAATTTQQQQQQAAAAGTTTVATATSAAAAAANEVNSESNVATPSATTSSSSNSQGAAAAAVAVGNVTASTSHDAKSQREAEQPTGSTTVSAPGALAGAAINKKIPKHKWRPLQIDLAKSSRPKLIGGRPNRRFSDEAFEQRRPPRVYNERGSTAAAAGAAGRTADGQATASASGAAAATAAGATESRSHGGRYAYSSRTSAAPERVDSWRSSGPSAAGNEEQRAATAAEGGAGAAGAGTATGVRGPRRFRTPYRGGRQGRGGFTRPGPGRPTNRIPRHLLASGEYINYLPADAAGADSSQSYVLMGTHYFGNVPAAYIEMDAASVKEAIKKQV